MEKCEKRALHVCILMRTQPWNVWNCLQMLTANVCRCSLPVLADAHCQCLQMPSASVCRCSLPMLADAHYNVHICSLLMFADTRGHSAGDCCHCLQMVAASVCRCSLPVLAHALHQCLQMHALSVCRCSRPLFAHAHCLVCRCSLTLFAETDMGSFWNPVKL